MAVSKTSSAWSPSDIQDAGRAELLQGRANQRAVKREYKPSLNPGEKPNLRWVSKERLYVDPSFQRLVNMEHVGSILSDFRYGYLHPINTGPETEKGFSIIDGQHEWLAAMRHPEVEELPIVEAWWADTVEKQADIFVTINRNRINISSTGVFYARVAQGDPEAVWMDQLLVSAGVRMSRVMTAPLPPLMTCAIGTLRKLRPFELYLRQALEMMAAAWPNHPDSFQGTMIDGVTCFLKMHTGKKLEIERLRSVLTKMASGEEAGLARRRANEFGESTRQVVMDMLRVRYNERLSTDKELPWIKWAKDRVPHK